MSIARYEHSFFQTLEKDFPLYVFLIKHGSVKQE